MGFTRDELHPDDVDELQRLRGQLRQARIDAGVSGYGLSAQLGRHREFVSHLERGVTLSPFMSTLQVWAAGLGLRVEFGVLGLWMFHQSDHEMLDAYAQSRPWGADEQARRWLVLALRAWRVRRGLDVAVVAPLLSTDGEQVRHWEANAHDPTIGRAMLQARVTGTRVTLRVWSRDEWIFGG